MNRLDIEKNKYKNPGILDGDYVEIDWCYKCGKMTLNHVQCNDNGVIKGYYCIRCLDHRCDK